MEIDPYWNVDKAGFLEKNLYIACRDNDLEKAKDVLETAKHTYEKDGKLVRLNMCSCFEAAVENKHFEVAQYLLDNGVPWHTMFFGFYEYVDAIYSTEREGFQTDKMNEDPTEIFQFYTEHGVDINFLYLGITALDYAIKVGYPVIEKALRYFGAKQASELTETEIQAQLLRRREFS